MQTLRDLIKDRSGPRIAGKSVSVDLIKGQRDSIQNLINGWKLESFGKTLGAFQAVAVPGLESIQEDLIQISLLKTEFETTSQCIKNVLLVCDHYKPSIKVDLNDYSRFLASQVGACTYLLLCGSKGHLAISKALPKVLRQCLELAESCATLSSLAGDLLDQNSKRAIANMNADLTRFAIDPVYGRLSDEQQIRSLYGFYKDGRYCDPIRPADDFWPSVTTVIETSLFDSDDFKLDAIAIELIKTNAIIKRWGTGVKRTTRDHLGETYLEYMSATLDRTVALTILVSCIRDLASCLVQFVHKQLQYLQKELVIKLNPTDYDLSLDELFNRI